MPQSILAILALLMATTFVMQQQRSTLHTRAQLIRNEIALQSTGVAESVLSDIGTRAFDQETETGGALDEASDLTPEGEFGGSGVRTAIEDYHNQMLTGKRPFRADTLDFTVEVEVTYVKDDQETPVDYRTKNKMATVTVRSTDISNPVESRVSRSYTCLSKCEW